MKFCSHFVLFYVEMSGKVWYTGFMNNMNGKSNRKNNRKNNRKKLQLNAKGRIFATMASMFLLSLLIQYMMTWFDTYDGLGEREVQTENPYDQSAFFYDEKGRLCYEDETWTSCIGVDVSSYQKEVDWQQVAADGVEFAMVRLGYRGYSSGMLNLDPYFEQNVKGAKESGLQVGVYFFSQALTTEEALDEARFVLRKIRGKKLDGPIAFDMEYIEGVERINSLTVEEKTAIADAFCQFIEKNGYEAMIYGNPNWFSEDVDLSLLTHHEIWLAHYIDMTQWPFEYAMWQYTDSGSVAGITGGCDLNIWLKEKKYLAE